MHIAKEKLEEEARTHRHQISQQAGEAETEKKEMEESHLKSVKDAEAQHACTIKLQNKKETKAKNIIATMRRERQDLLNQASLGNGVLFQTVTIVTTLFNLESQLVSPIL